MSCPLRYRYRVVDRLPELPTAAAVRGTLVHRVLERLFDLPRERRTLEDATGLIASAWRELRDTDPRVSELFDSRPGGEPESELLLAGESATDPPAIDVDEWLQSIRDLLATYFRLEDPARVQPQARELLLEHDLLEGLRLRGIVDRLDAARTGELRIVDYKTGRSPGPAFEKSALFQMKFYALLLWHERGVVPRELRLYYLGDQVSLVYHPEEAELQAFERTLAALWAAIRRAHETGDWRPRRSKLCQWCDHRSRCPEFGGQVLPLPVPAQQQPAAVS